MTIALPTPVRPSADPDREAELLSAVADGDRSAFEELYTTFSPRVHGLAQRLLVDRHQAEEVTQEVFLQVWQQAHRFDRHRGSASSWVLHIAHARSVDRIRNNTSRRARDLRVASREHVAETDTVVESVTIAFEQAAVRQQLERLSPKQREAIMLSYYQGLTMSAISTLLAIPVPTVKTRVRNALSALAKLLAEQPEATPGRPLRLAG